MSNQQQIINSIIENFKSENDLKDKNLFEVFSIMQILNKKDIEIEDAYDSVVDGGQDGGIDSVIFLINDKYLSTEEELREMILNKEINRKSEVEISIIQIKDSENYKETVFDRLSLTFVDIFDLKKDEKKLLKNYNTELIDKVKILRIILNEVAVLTNNISLSILYVNKGDSNKTPISVKNRGNLLEEQVKELVNIKNIEIKYYGCDELRSAYLEPEECELIIKYNDELNSIFLHEKNVAYIITANLKDYYEFITNEDKIRENIFESNVRHFQGNVTVNGNIINTLKDEKDIEFWWLNNGITILVSEIVPLPANKLKLTNVQIVNGLQTTFCIYNEFKDKDIASENRSIMIKIIKTDDSKYIDKIISSTNSQTEVRAADLRATDELQRDIESYFLSKGYYYDRRKNFYKNQRKERNKIFSIAKTAQYIETLLYKKPNNARSNPTSLLKSDDNYSRIFTKDNSIEVYLNSCLIYKVVDRYVKDIESSNDPVQLKYRTSIKNFTFHLMLIIVCVHLRKASFTDKDIAKIDINNINIEEFEEAVKFLIECLDEFNLSSEIENAINIAKSKAFTDKLDTMLKARY